MASVFVSFSCHQFNIQDDKIIVNSTLNKYILVHNLIYYYSIMLKDNPESKATKCRQRSAVR